MNPDYNLAYIQSMGLPAPTLAQWGAIFPELVGGFALAVGYRTSIVAAAMALFSLATALIFHQDFSDPNQQIHFFKTLVISGGKLLLVAFGPGVLAVDSRC